MTWVLFDYGNVISLDQPKAERDAMADTAGADRDAFAQAYWKHRPEYDRGTLTDAAYWTFVLDRDAEPGEVERLVELDIASWTHPNHDTLEILGRLPGRVALLSNAPASMADGIDRQPWMDGIAPRFYSGRMGLVKPGEAIYRAVLEGLGAEPGEVTFVDDRLANIEAAERLGLVGIHFREAADLAPLLTN
ncbi:HAD-IA family hydrolase [Nonomuraea sp. NPDC046570]|uniref:HAD-IA family hydrolase n=1 Tax=Nonomuraea sp. NPDC046570 TaxID=3155255 RepID=UPI0033F65F23